MVRMSLKIKNLLLAIIQASSLTNTSLCYLDLKTLRNWLLRTLNAPLSSLITDSSLTNSRGRWSCERRLSTLYLFLNFFNVSTICPDGQMIIVSLLQKISKQKAGTPSQGKPSTLSFIAGIIFIIMKSGLCFYSNNKMNFSSLKAQAMIYTLFAIQHAKLCS